MKINLDEILKARDGQNMLLPDQTALSLKDALLMALENTPSQMDGNEKYVRYRFLKKIETMDGETDFSAEEIVRLKKAVGEYPFVTMIHGQIWDWLEQKETSTKLEMVK